MIHLALEVLLELYSINGLLQNTWEMSSYLLHMPRLPSLGFYPASLVILICLFFPLEYPTARQ